MDKMNNIDNNNNNDDGDQNINNVDKKLLITSSTTSSSSTSQSQSSSSSSPTNTLIQSPKKQQLQQQIDSNYEELIEKTKQRMNKKFDHLEKETGLSLNKKTIDIKTMTNNLNEKFRLNFDDIDDLKLLKQSEQLLLINECNRLKEELRLKNEIINKMLMIRTNVENELEDLTVSLFEEANKMVYNANVLRDRSEKELYEANLKIDMLTAEVQALKLLVITSTPSKPNLHLLHNNNNNKINYDITSINNQQNSPIKNNDNKKKQQEKQQSILTITKKSPSNYELISNSKSNNLLNNKLSTIYDDQQNDDINNNNNSNDDDDYYNNNNNNLINEIDPIFFDEFQQWLKLPTLEPIDSNFMKRIYDEEIYPVFNFKNKQLTSLIIRSIESNTLTIEMIGNSNNNNNNNCEKLPFPKKCSLLEIPRICRYRMCIDLNNQNQQKWYLISQLCRNRIITVCDLFCYLRYIKQGLIKCKNQKYIYWQIMKKRNNIARTKLGFQPLQLSKI